MKSDQDMVNLPEGVPDTWEPQATSRMCFVCGRQNPVGLHVTFYEDRERRQVMAPVVLSDDYQGYPGIAHGGVLATLLDETSGRALMVGTEEDIFWVTAKLEVRYRKPTPTGIPLRVVGWVVDRRRRSAEVAGEIRLPDGTVTVEATAVIVRPPGEVLKDWEQEQAFWRVEREESS
ncbi:MAG: PaaI family thioesterase [Anaerolineae bacterium]